MVVVSPQLLARVVDSYGAYYERLSGIPAAKLASDVLDEDKVHEQIGILSASLGIPPAGLRGRRMLEVGSGFGIFVAVTRRDYGIESWGLEPAGEGFDTSYAIAQSIAAEYRIPAGAVLNAEGESIPFPDDHFDLVYSSNVLEHTRRPEQVLAEAVRVLRPGGTLQFVFPNYGAPFEGHYAIPWIPFMPRAAARRWVRLWGRDPAYVDTLQLVDCFWARRWLRSRPDVECRSLGEEVFARRMAAPDAARWAGLTRLRPWLELARKLRLVHLATRACIAGGMFSPIILTLTKRPRP